MQQQEPTYGQIVKSTGIFGGSQVFNLLLGIVRTKLVAVLLGPVGVGLISLYQNIVDMVRSVTDLGLGFSSVRDMSAAAASDDELRKARTAKVLRRWILLTSVSGALVTILFSRQISQLAFHDAEHVFPICLLSLCVLMSSLSAGQRALLQGMRRIGDMAAASVVGSTLACAVSVALYYFFGQDGIIPAFLATGLVMLLCSTWYAWRLKFRKVALTLKETLRHGRGMVVLGCYSMVVGVVSTLISLLIRSLIELWSDMGTVGLFQSSNAIAAMALSSIFAAMAADYYPRLCGVGEDKARMSRYVNEQMRVALLLSTPVLVAMLVLAPWILRVFNSADFVSAQDLLRWQLLGCFLKVLNWPLGYVPLSRGKGLVFMLTELLWHGLYLGLACLLWQVMALEGIGVAYLGAHLIYTVVMLLIVGKMCDFRMDARNLTLGSLLGLLTLLAFLWPRLQCAPWCRWLLAGLLMAATGALSLWELNRIWPLRQHLGRFIQKLRSR